MLRTGLLWLLKPFGSSMGIDEAAGKLPADGELGGTAQPAPVQAAILPPCLEKSRYICHRAQAER